MRDKFRQTRLWCENPYSVIADYSGVSDASIFDDNNKQFPCLRSTRIPQLY